MDEAAQKRMLDFMLERYIADPHFDYESMFNAGFDALDDLGMEGKVRKFFDVDWP